ncbi:MAG: hypothetical protein A2Y10_02400 [Planctomycetes bacterium GWF2_41_51]|nr:MAG: hypothetical protein A2Y10_02400 [Planctomycetes bacterium GWF2_41_51]HBG27280.1 sodium:solute symporter [Phycisphaerales bacterium]
MQLVDWLITSGLLIFLLIVAYYTNKRTQSVADFLAANRCAGRYMLAVSGDMASLGAITILAWFEMYYKGGFSAAWWLMMTMPIATLIALSGWVIYRYRQTRAMTVAQFFEMRYSRNFRVFSGILCFIAGILNFGIFPSAGARFFIYFCNLPHSISIIDGYSVSTYPVLMAILLIVSLFFAFGGQITVIVTDFLQGILCNLLFIVIIIFLMYVFDWTVIKEALLIAPSNASLINPFDSHGVEDFNIKYFIILTFATFYNFMAWQGSAGYNCSAINANEQRMGRAIGTLRSQTHSLLFILLPIIVYAVMNHPKFSGQADQISISLERIDNEYLRSQMIVPAASCTLLKTGLMGCMCAIMLSAFISVHDTYLLSWGSIFIQDVFMPLRKKTIKPEQHVRLLRVSICGVAAFAFFWSLYFRQNESIFLYFAITAAVYLGGAGSVLIGGLYWKRGTTQAAWTTMIAGSILAVTGIIIRQIKPDFLLNGQEISLVTMLISISLYVLVSLFGKKTEFNMDKLLYRGKYADEKSDIQSSSNSVKDTILQRLGITKELSSKDKITYIACISWVFIWFCCFIIGTIYNLIINRKVSNSSWADFWHIYIYVSLAASIIVTIWLSIGGVKDMMGMFRMLKTTKRDHSDNGSVPLPKQDYLDDISETVKIED